jgi:hypothetical protein
VATGVDEVVRSRHGRPEARRRPPPRERPRPPRPAACASARQHWYIALDALEEFAQSYTRPTRGREWLRPEAARPVLEALSEHEGATVGQLAELVDRPAAQSSAGCRCWIRKAWSSGSGAEGLETPTAASSPKTGGRSVEEGRSRRGRRHEALTRTVQ